MQQWTLERYSESPESTGRPSLTLRDSKLHKSEGRRGRRSGRTELRQRASVNAFPSEPLSFAVNRLDGGGDGEDDEEGEGRSSVPQRLSRHIPQRVGTDMSVSSFNLIASPVCLSQSSASSTRTMGGVGSGRAHTFGALTGRAATPGSTAGASSPTFPHGGAGTAAVSGGGGAGGSSAAGSTVPPTPSSSVFTSFTESIVSDDSTYMTSLYNDVLASNLIGPHHLGGSSGSGSGGMVTNSTAVGGATAGEGRGVAALYGRPTPTLGDHHSTSSGRIADGQRSGDSGSEERGVGLRGAADGAHATARRGLGGEVLRFADTTCAEGTARGFGAASPAVEVPPGRVATYTTKGTRGGTTAPSSAVAAVLPRVRSRTFYTSGSGGGPARVFNTTPERVLDAPQFPPNGTQLLDWGANNVIVIGMGQSLYSWSGDSGQAAKVVDLDSAARIRCVQWLHKCSCVALSVQDGTTAIYDCRSSDFLRTVRLPAGLQVTGLSVKGPIMAVASDGPAGTTCAYDLRAKDALIATYEGHCGGVASLHYCAAEPFYLATGGRDGSVRVWDARRAAAPRYALDGVHHGSVNVVRWDPQKRSRLFSGGEDGVLCLMDTHAPRRTMEMDVNMNDEEGGGGVGCGQELLTQYITRAVNTQFPITGLACHGPSGEVVTAHKLKGQLQLRKTSTLHLLSTFTALHCDAPLSCLTMAPDKESVCAAQGDDTLKFWRVFNNSSSGSKGGVTRSGDRSATAGGRVEWGSSSHQDPTECYDEALR